MSNAKPKKKPIKFNRELSELEKARGVSELRRLSTVTDVLYALMIFQLFMILPRPELDNFTVNELKEVLLGSYVNYLVMAVGILMVIIYWGQSNILFGSLERSNPTHAALSILQVFILMIYLYLVRLDIEMDGAVVLLKLESIVLAIAGFLGMFSWYYSIKNRLVSDDLSKEEAKDVYLKMAPEPIVSLLTFPFASFGPDIWTLAWLLLIPVTILTNRLRSKLPKEILE